MIKTLRVLLELLSSNVVCCSWTSSYQFRCPLMSSLFLKSKKHQIGHQLPISKTSFFITFPDTWKDFILLKATKYTSLSNSQKVFSKKFIKISNKQRESSNYVGGMADRKYQFWNPSMRKHLVKQQLNSRKRCPPSNRIFFLKLSVRLSFSSILATLLLLYVPKPIFQTPCQGFSSFDVPGLFSVQTIPQKGVFPGYYTSLS